MVKWLYLLATSALGTLALMAGQGALGAALPSPMAWYDDLMQKGPTAGAYVHRLLIVEKVANGHVKTRGIDAKELKTNSYFDVMDARETEYRYTFNLLPGTPVAQKQDKRPMEQIFAEIFATTYADTIIYAPLDDERWSIYRPESQDTAKREFIVKGPVQDNVAAISKWLVEKLGYSGIVLDRKDEYILVATYKQLNEADAAMLVIDSADQLRVKKSQMNGGALLKRFECWRSICVFKILIDTNKTFPSGTKVFY